MANDPNTRKTLRLHDFRTSYCYVYTQPVGDDGQPQSFGSHLIFPETHPEFPLIAQAIESVGQAFFKDKWPEVKAEMKGKDKLCLHRGDISKAGQEPYRGNLYLAAYNKSRPRLVDQMAIERMSNDGLFYSGCRVDPIVTFYCSVHPKGGRRVCCELNGMQFRADAERLSGGYVAPASEFKPIDGAAADAPPPATGTAGLV